MISAFASVLKCKLKPTTAADVSAVTLSLSTFTANTVKVPYEAGGVPHQGITRNATALEAYFTIRSYLIVLE